MKISRGNKIYLFCKRAFDLVFSFFLLAVLALPMIVIAMVIKCGSDGPVLYRSIRIGKGGVPFAFLKFRTMYDQADEMQKELLTRNEIAGGVTFKMTDDPRVTKVGRFLRKYSIDELPQLICVLKGDMSLIGPRPGTQRELSLYSSRDRRRLEVDQGMSGEWQVYGRSDVSFSEMIEMDIDYIDNKRSFFYDLKLVFLTIGEVFGGKGK